jgi:hypothetical protein
VDDDYMTQRSTIDSEPPSWTASSPTEVVELARRWMTSPPLRELLSTLGGPSPDSDPAALLRWSGEHLDTRGGVERHEAAPTAWAPDWVHAILAAAGPLGLLETAQPHRRDYGALLMLGGTVTGNRLRTALTARLLSSGVRSSTLAVVSADRPLTKRELEGDRAPTAGTEWEDALGCVDDTLGPLRHEQEQAGGSGVSSWRDLRLSRAGVPPVRVLVAPATGKHLRATTADGIQFALERIPDELRHEVLLITSAIYAPYQFFTSAPILLARGTGWVELIGTPTAAERPGQLLAQRLGQEVHAAIASAVELIG